MNKKTQEQLLKTWAPIYYEHVFRQIDEVPFAFLYCADNGRPNFPVNILLSLEFIKHMKDYTDEEVIEQFYYNYQIHYALGLRNLGELYLAPRTLYEFRERVYRYTIENAGKDNLVFGQFEQLTQHFIDVAKITIHEQRMDSTQVMPNIKRAGRLSLLHDVLVQALKSCLPELVPEDLQRVLEPDYKNTLLYRCKGSEAHSRVQETIGHIVHLLALVAAHPDVEALATVQLAKRCLTEQARFDVAQNTWVAKENKEITADSLQSAYDPDATFRQKAGKGHTGYVVNLAETCADENPVQFVTDYTVEKNVVSDTRMIQDRLPALQGKMDASTVYADGGYYGADVQTQTQELEVEIHYTDMTGRKANPEKVPISAFVIDNQQIIVACPTGQLPTRSDWNPKSHVLSAHFQVDICMACPLRNTCPVKFQKQDTILRVSQKAVIAADVRAQMLGPGERRESTSKRAAIEGTNSALKRAQGMGKLRVRTQAKSTVVVGLKVMGHNIRQMVRFIQGNVRKATKTCLKIPTQGMIAPI